ncbi:isoleucine--tRNA ligase [Kallotenue papyrolyticum]|uniref:isoleucine--tRNA ligase n=1 Tax=Kallotenue papyrolyticum TaxID=1325125 RepID=UPI0004925132|nr:isoleucine--tRNA ligase [Kallotenue papyrolyticum]
MAFKAVDTRVSFPELEQAIQQWWQEHDIVKRSLNSGDRSRPFVFFEGPPTANGKPGVHHVEARVVKDIINRFRRMQGHYVIGARGGWDTHGLPVEVEVEKELGFKGKPDIEKFGIEEFNRRCRESVNRYVDEFERLTERIAFWLDLDNPYWTYSNDYIESLWWILKQLWERDLLFRDYKVTMHCPRCGTTLADAEVALGFQDNVEDPSVWIKFRVKPGDHPLAERLSGAFLLAWTTTPWTLPANVALAVKPGATYVLAEKEGQRYVLAEALAPQVLGEDARVLDAFRGEELVGLRYENLFQGVPAAGDSVDWNSAYRVVADDFVSLEDGTGIVHIAPAYGDLEIGRKYGLPTLFSVDLSGNVLPEFNDLGFGGLFFKDADALITRNLSERGLLFKAGRVRHAYPFCWRCNTPLLYYAKRSWYIRTTAKKDRLIANNQLIHWVPEHIKHGRFGNWLENNIDWAISRERYWGTPLPIWTCDACGQIEVIGSVAELSAKAGRDLSGLDLHRPYVDEPSWRCASCGEGSMRRIPDVADAWFDSGSMPVAQWHYPFENQELFAIAGQADFISEAIDQTRGWFYTLHAVATLLFDRPAFKNVICLGHILDIHGEKMSKSRGNVVDPFMLLEQYGADATRWYMYASAPPYNPRRFAPEHVGEMLRQFILTLWNTYSFLVTYANLDGWTPPAGLGSGRTPPDTSALQPIDRWALARLNQLVRDVTADLEDYDIYQPTKRIEGFVEELSNWYVRRNRRRFWKSESDADKQAAYVTLYTCLTTLARLLAPFTPFLAEEMYRNLVATHDADAPESVHLAAWPTAHEALIDERLLADTEVLLRAVTAGRAARKASGIKVRQPLRMLLVRAQSAAQTEGLRRFEDELRDELNVKEVRYLDAGDGLVEYRFKPNLRLVGKKYGKLVPAIRAALENLKGEAAREAGRRVEAGQPIVVSVDCQPLELQAEEVLLETSSPEGYAVAEENGVLVALDTTLTDELRLEGAARDLVRTIQDARKEAGFAIADRIQLFLSGLGAHHEGVSLERLLEQYGDYIRTETLAREIQVGAIPAQAHTVEAEIGGVPLRIGLVRA